MNILGFAPKDKQTLKHPSPPPPSQIKKVIKRYTVYPFSDAIGAVPLSPIIGYIYSIENGMTIIKDEFNDIICILTGNYCIIEKP